MNANVAVCGMICQCYIHILSLLPQVAIKAAVSVGFSYIAVNFCSFLF